MEEKNDQTDITNADFNALIAAAKNKDQEETLRLIELFKKDIQHISRFIYLPTEEATSEILVEFLEFLHSEK